MSDHPPFEFIAIAPGRVNLLGEHVDYNGGSVLPAAIDLYLQLEFSPRDDRLVVVEATDFGQTATFSLSSLDDRSDISGQKLPGWALFPAGVAWSLQASGLKLPGLNCRFTSSIPIGSGLSSSAAVEVAFAAAWNYLSGVLLNNQQLALLAQEAENRYVGVHCGIMDQFACANGVAGHAILLDTRTLDFQPVPLPKGTAIIIADSGERRTLNHSAYNDRRAGCEQALFILSARLPGIQTLRDVSSHQLNDLVHLLPDPVNHYARHVIEECERVDESIRLLQRDDATGFGALMYQCHRSLRDLYQVSTPGLDALVEIASTSPGCLGARLTGAGFGGCTVNLVEESRAGEFITALRTGYLAATGKDALVYPCKASEGVKVSPINP